MIDRDGIDRRLVDWLATAPDADESALTEVVRREVPLASSSEVGDMVHRALRRAAGLGAIAPLFEDQAISEIMINGPGPVWIDRGGELTMSGIEIESDDVHVLIDRIVSPLGLRVDRSSPIVDARLRDGSRVNIVVPPLAIDGPVVTIRRFRQGSLSLEAFGDPDVCDLLERLVVGRAAMVVVGGTGAGKTSLLNALGRHIPDHERVVTVEDTAELQFTGRHTVRLECRPSNSEGVGEVSMRDLVRNALRMRPDRIVVGETRGPETLDLLIALNTGHDGSLATCHANDPLAGLVRLETLALLGAGGLPAEAIRSQVLSSLDIVVHVARTRGGRAVTAVGEVCPNRLGIRQLWPRPDQPKWPVRPRVIEALG